jgi:DNA-binding LacI/PurR family transcriptional regulator
VGGLSRIGLMTIAQPVAELARSSVDLLLGRVLGELPEERRHVQLEPRLIVRSSMAPTGSFS